MAGTASGGARALRRVVIGIVVLAIVLVLADRAGNYLAERTAGDTIQTSQELSSRPGVDIDGFPFLTQLAAGRFGKITVTASNVTLGSGGISLRISRIRVVLHDVTVSRDFSSVRADTAAADALVGYRDLSKTLGADIGYNSEDRVKATKSITVAGQTVGGTITAQPLLVNGALSFGRTEIDGLGRLGGHLAGLLSKVFDVSVPLQGIPFKIRVTSLTVDELGVHIGLTGSDLSYSD